MDHNEQAQRMYQQQLSAERGQNAMQNIYVPSQMAARFRPPSTMPPAPPDVSQTLDGPGQRSMEPSHFTGSYMQGGLQYPQFTVAPEPLGYAAQHHQHITQFAQSPTFFYGHQTAPSPDQAAQDQMQRYQSSVGRNASITSSSSQYSLPRTPQSQYFGSVQGIQFPTRSADTGDHSSSASFESVSYTQASTNYPSNQSAGQMLPPSSFSGYQQPQHQQNRHARGIPEVDEAYEMYQNKAREIFTLVRDGQLRETYDHLLYISRYLIGNADTLGLDKDDKNLYEERLKLWDTFNNTWLTTLQAQLELTREMLAQGGHPQPLRHPQSLLGVDEMEDMGQELVRLCDGISVFGLVDYQMGVAEEEILELLIKCLDLIAPLPTDTPRPSGS